MKRFASFATLAALSVACVAPEAPPPLSCDRIYTMSSEFSASEQEAIRQAAARWNAIAVTQFCLSENAEAVSEDEEHSIIKIKDGSVEWQEISLRLNHLNWVGLYRSQLDQIILVEEPIPTFSIIALHEFGHAHGLEHTQAPAIMYKTVGTADDFTEKDLTECRRVFACAAPKEH